MNGRLGIGTLFELDDLLAVTHVRRAGRSARIDEPDYTGASGPIAHYLRRTGTRSAVAGPVVVDGRLWGAVVVSTQHQRLPGDSEKRIANFTDIVATVIANAEHQAELAA